MTDTLSLWRCSHLSVGYWIWISYGLSRNWKTCKGKTPPATHCTGRNSMLSRKHHCRSYGNQLEYRLRIQSSNMVSPCNCSRYCLFCAWELMSHRFDIEWWLLLRWFYSIQTQYSLPESGAQLKLLTESFPQLLSVQCGLFLVVLELLYSSDSPSTMASWMIRVWSSPITPR